MDHQDQLKLQAYLDGELPEPEAREMANHLARDPGATALLTELRQTRDAIRSFEPGTQLPESREFYWSKIKREIERQETSRPVPSPSIPLGERLRRFLIPASGLALLVIAGLFAIQGPPQENAPIETALADPGAMIYHDYSAGATYVWLSYPADKDLADEDDWDTFD
ncbi:MAG TPA: zf-HC2 domain-containing protein [Candidatus Limnocylindrales bacterium]|jgi:anti-sigma factor RsiW|nr:zf-HC2 domain-containing protein [Candidatus Limnocylindrales bacterium]